MTSRKLTCRVTTTYRSSQCYAIVPNHCAAPTQPVRRQPDARAQAQDARVTAYTVACVATDLRKWFGLEHHVEFNPYPNLTAAQPTLTIISDV